MKNTHTQIVAIGVTIVALIFSQFSGAQSAKPKLASKVTIQTQSNYIDAPLVDDGLYYYRADGSKVSFLRKQDVYLVQAKSQRSDAAKQAMLGLKSRFQQGVETVNKHHLGAGATVVRINRQAARAPLSGAALKAADNRIENMMPVLANSQGEGDIVMLPGMTVAFKKTNLAQAIQLLQSKYGLRLNRRLNITGQIYSFAFKANNLEPWQQLSAIRAISQEGTVKWAEPHIHEKPIKSTFEPNDALFGQQWHLRNTGQQGARCDSDCDANNAWDLDIGSGASGGMGAVTGVGTVIAVIDDGVQLTHPDLLVDTTNDKDFVNDTSACGNDGTAGPDNDASPNPTTGCVVQGETIDEDNHGTAVAGIAAAVGNNNIGVAGVAYNATILPIRAISDYSADGTLSNNFCTTIAEAMEYAGKHADVINNSWQMLVPCMALETAITNVVDGTIMDNGSNVSHRANKGSPVVFASGNFGSGWLKVTVPVSAGKKTFEWRFLRDAFGDSTVNDDTVWLDDITWPDNTVESFESGLGELVSNCTVNTCNQDCATSLCTSSWSINTNPIYTRTGTQSVAADLNNGECDYTYLSTEKQTTAGNMSFWVWVSTETGAQLDRFEFLIDGKEIVSFGDLPRNVNNDVAYPASLSATIDGVIAVGASNDGDLSGNQSAPQLAEERVYYSQFGAALDVLAPSGNQHQLITTTDRTGTDGYNTLASPTGNQNYTDLFSGTSAAAPIVSGIAAAMIAVDNTLSAAAIRTKIRQTADKIGPIAYDNGGTGRNDFYGYGRVNMAKALQSANDDTPTDPGGDSCNISSFNFPVDFAAGIYQPQPTEFCRSIIPDKSELCVPIKTQNNNVAVICL